MFRSCGPILNIGNMPAALCLARLLFRILRVAHSIQGFLMPVSKRWVKTGILSLKNTGHILWLQSENVTDIHSSSAVGEEVADLRFEYVLFCKDVKHQPQLRRKYD